METINRISHLEKTEYASSGSVLPVGQVSICDLLAGGHDKEAGSTCLTLLLAHAIVSSASLVLVGLGIANITHYFVLRKSRKESKVWDKADFGFAFQYPDHSSLAYDHHMIRDTQP